MDPEAKTDSKPKFGRLIKQEFLLHPDFVHLNHGSYGTYPKFVQKSLHSLQLQAEMQSDLWFRMEAKGELQKARGQLASLLNIDCDDLVFVPNATSGINAVLRSLDFNPGDKILYFNTTYNSIQKLVQYLADSNSGKVIPLKMEVTFPMSNGDLIEVIRTFLLLHEDKIRIAIVDHISSTPAVIWPIDQIIEMLRAHNILVLIDGAHAIGQIPVDLTKISPDFYVTNCHKWLFAPRGCSVLYVRKKFQHLIHPVSIAAHYEKPGTRFQDEFFWTGTMDFSSYLSVSSALEFRQNVGGEEEIMSYNHGLALEGGKYLSTLFGTCILQQDGQMGSMVDILLPLNDPEDGRLTEEFWLEEILVKHKAVAVPHKHGGKWWLRASAQIYNDIHDFERIGAAFLKICQDINCSKSQGSNSIFIE